MGNALSRSHLLVYLRLLQQVRPFGIPSSFHTSSTTRFTTISIVQDSMGSVLRSSSAF